MSDIVHSRLTKMIAAHRAEGADALPIDLVEAELAAAQAAEDREIARQQAQARLDISVKAYEHSVQLGQTAIRQSFLLNGGAGAALLAYLGQMIAAGQEPGALMIALAAWAVGAFSATCANGFSFLAQSRYTEAAGDPEASKAVERQGDHWRYWASCCVITALLGFATGCLVAGGALLAAW